MKNAISLFIKGLLAIFVIGLVSSCESKLPTDLEVAQKIETGQKLTEADYTTMIDYCGKYAKEAQQFYDVINAQPNDSTAEYIKASDDLAQLFGNYAYLTQFRKTLAAADVTRLGADNEKKVDEYAKYQGFPLPGGEGADLENPAVVGMIEQTPSVRTTDSTGVISTGAGEAVDVQVKQ